MKITGVKIEGYQGTIVSYTDYLGSQGLEKCTIGSVSETRIMLKANTCVTFRFEFDEPLGGQAPKIVYKVYARPQGSNEAFELTSVQGSIEAKGGAIIVEEGFPENYAGAELAISFGLNNPYKPPFKDKGDYVPTVKFINLISSEGKKVKSVVWSETEKIEFGKVAAPRSTICRNEDGFLHIHTRGMFMQKVRVEIYEKDNMGSPALLKRYVTILNDNVLYLPVKMSEIYGLAEKARATSMEGENFDVFAKVVPADGSISAKESGMIYLSIEKQTASKRAISTVNGIMKCVIGEANNGNTNNEKCTKCKNAITEDDLKHIKDNSIPSSFSVRLSQILPFLNKYMTEFGINKNCRRKAHFLGQVAKETGFWSYFEDFTHTEDSLKSANFPNRAVIIEKGYYKKNGKISTENEIRMANIGYGTGAKAKELGNSEVAEKDWADPTKDGYKYRGRGLIQLTGKNNYIAFQKWYDKHKEKQGWDNKNFVDDPDLLSKKEAGNKVSNPELMVLLAIYFWDQKNLNATADNSDSAEKISKIINFGESEAKRTERQNLVHRASVRFRDELLCTYSELSKTKFEETDIITYHIISTMQKIIKQVPAKNKYPDKRRYIYHDKKGTKHTIQDFDVMYINRIEDKYAPKGVDGKVEMINDIKQFKSFESADKTIKAGVGFWDSNEFIRYYINPECFAALLGAMLDLNINYLAFRGSSKIDGTAGKSKTHLNGVATDIAYFNKKKTTNQVLLAEEQFDMQTNIDFINALIAYGYKYIGRFFTEKFIPYGEKKQRLLVDGMGQAYSPPHNNHLHIGGFDFSTVVIKND